MVLVCKRMDLNAHMVDNVRIIVGKHGWQNEWLTQQVFTKWIFLLKPTDRYISGWWFGTFFIFPYIGNFIIPIDFHIFQRGGPGPPTRSGVIAAFERRNFRRRFVSSPQPSEPTTAAGCDRHGRFEISASRRVPRGPRGDTGWWQRGWRGFARKGAGWAKIGESTNYVTTFFGTCFFCGKMSCW